MGTVGKRRKCTNLRLSRPPESLSSLRTRKRVDLVGQKEWPLGGTGRRAGLSRATKENRRQRRAVRTAKYRHAFAPSTPDESRASRVGVYHTEALGILEEAYSTLGHRGMATSK